MRLFWYQKATLMWHGLFLPNCRPNWDFKSKTYLLFTTFAVNPLPLQRPDSSDYIKYWNCSMVDNTILYRHAERGYLQYPVSDFEFVD